MKQKLDDLPLHNLLPVFVKELEEYNPGNHIGNLGLSEGRIVIYHSDLSRHGRKTYVKDELLSILGKGHKFSFSGITQSYLEITGDSKEVFIKGIKKLRRKKPINIRVDKLGRYITTGSVNGKGKFKHPKGTEFEILYIGSSWDNHTRGIAKIPDVDGKFKYVEITFDPYYLGDIFPAKWLHDLDTKTSFSNFEIVK